MEVKTMSPTSPDFVNVAIINGLLNYNLNISGRSHETTFLFRTAAVSIAARNTSALFCGLQIPYICITEDSTEDAISVEEKVQKVLSFYNIGKSHLCKISGISRPALYAWLDGSSEPDVNNFSKVEQLYLILRELDASGNHSIHHEYIDKALPGESKSLFELFVENKRLDISLIRNLVSAAFNKSISRSKNLAKRRTFEFKITHSEAEEELNLERNL